MEELTKKAFWNVNVPGCDEHYLVHVLREHADFVPALDLVAEADGRLIGNLMAAKGMRVLGSPAGTDPRIVSGESGAAAVGLVAELMTNGRLRELRRAIGLGADSRVLCVSTEGDTDRASYRAIVWDGAYPSF